MPLTILPIEAEHDAAICQIIKQVGAEFGAVGEGFGPADEEVLTMSKYYTQDRHSLYLVALLDNDIVGGGGIAPFQDSGSICELKKLFLLAKSRGYGGGRIIAERCLEFAKSQGFQYCYLDTLSSMSSAITLYERLGFERLSKPLEGTEHGGCDVWMMKKL